MDKFTNNRSSTEHLEIRDPLHERQTKLLREARNMEMNKEVIESNSYEQTNEVTITKFHFGHLEDTVTTTCANLGKNLDHDLIHAALGLAGEAGEVVDRIKKLVIYGKEYKEEDYKNLVEEMGDILWYLELLRQTINASWSEIIGANRQKLQKRYATGKFSTEQALARADKKDGE